ncbi:hypothetical protein RKD23_007623 [Streptomyces sp. SAI-170]|uniref:hypothetical protein n=1 Tax=Streptomyces sp. SAI-170 TaxID=3377729 RepID=UPI003C7C0157
MLSFHLNAPVTHATGSVVINGSRVRGSQITVGPLAEPDTERESPVMMPTFGDESTAITYADQDAETPEYSPFREHVVARARVGTVAIEMDHGPVPEASDHLDRAVELMRMACDRARAAQASSQSTPSSISRCRYRSRPAA